MFYFNYRADARAFAKKSPAYKVKDCAGTGSKKRWAVRVLKSA